MWIIQNIEDPELVWSNELGWVEGSVNDYTLFTQAQRDTLNLPIGGQWVEVPA